MPDLTTPPPRFLATDPRTHPTPLGEEAELRQFIAANGLRDQLDAAMEIVRQSFPAGSEVTIRLWHSPEEDDTRVVVNVRAKTSVAEGVRCHQHLLERWTRELPLHAQGFIASTFSTS